MTSPFRLLCAEGTREPIDGVHVNPEFTDVDRSDHGKASVGPHEQEMTETTMREGEHITDCESSRTAATAGGSGDSRQPSPLQVLIATWMEEAAKLSRRADVRDGPYDDAAMELNWRAKQLRVCAVALIPCVNAHDALVSQREELKEAARKVLEGFAADVFVRDISGDRDPGWAIKLLPYINALARLAVLAKAGA